MPEQLTTIYALLIGIDHYPGYPSQPYKSLKGAVRDIHLMETYLKQTLKVSSEHICKLTAPNPDDTVLFQARSPLESKPTYENIVNAFKYITDLAQPGDHVYIHYSGHGGRAVTVYPTLKGDSTQTDEVIVPMDIGDAVKGRYLRDVEMTTLLKRMTDKALIVTVVLDSCHLGGATRGDVVIRSSGHIDTQARTGESLVAHREELERNWQEETRRPGISMAGFLQARKCVGLTACHSNAYAYEYAINGGTEKYGALTYWMHDTLTSIATSGQRLTYQLLYDRLNAQIQSRFPQQTPLLLGEGDRPVFGSDRWVAPFTVSVINVFLETQVTLNVGQAQGLSKGTRFSIYPRYTVDFTDKTQQVAIVELIGVDASESTARVLKPEEGGIDVTGKLEPGAPAVMVSAPVELVQRVRLIDDKTAGEQEHELPAPLVSLQKMALDKVRQVLAGNGWVVEEQAGESALYQVAVDRQGNYEICKGMPLPNLRPFLSIKDPTAPQRVVDRLVHLAKYQAVQSLDNSMSNLAQALDVELLQEDGTVFADPQNPIVHDGDIVCLRVINRSNRSLKVAVLDIEPTWAVSQLPIGRMDSPFFTLEQWDKEEIPLRMSLPADEAGQQVKEFFKVFAVSKGLADFRWLTLPRLDHPSETKGAKFDEELPSIVMRTVEGINPLNHLLKMIGSDVDKAPSVTRAASVVVDPKQEWVTKQVQIVVKRQFY